MKKIFIPLTVTLCLAALFFACTQGEKTIKLNYKYTPGMKLTYEQTSHHTTKAFNADTVFENYQTNYKIKIIQSVTEFKDGVGEIHELSTWLYEKKNPEDSTKIDTVVSKREMDFFVTTNGKIVDIKFPPENTNTYISYIKNYFEQGMPQFPTHEITVGYSWTQTTRVVSPDETLEASSTYKIKSLVRESGYDCAVIEYEGNLLIPVELNPEDSTQRQGLDKIQSTGMIYFAYKEGFIVLQRERYVIDGTRQVLKEGKIEKYQVAREADTDFILKKVEY